MIGSVGSGSLGEQRMNGLVWGPPSPPWKEISSSERATLVERGVIEAADHDVGDVRESIRALQVPCRRRRERSQGIVTIDATLIEVVGAGRAEDDRPVFGRANQQPADVGVLTQARSSRG